MVLRTSKRVDMLLRSERPHASALVIKVTNSKIVNPLETALSPVLFEESGVVTDGEKSTPAPANPTLPSKCAKAITELGLVSKEDQMRSRRFCLIF